MDKQDSVPDLDATMLSEDLRRTIGNFVRAVRGDANTPRTAQSETLGYLERGGAMNIATLAQLRNVKHQTMRLIVAQLEEAGLVQRSANPADRRSQLFALSNAGREELARERGARGSRIETMIRTQLSREERELLRASIRLLARMSAAPES
ncbi:MarR family transcriptional regulator [Azospirillum sp. TSO35-2]|uniref:MarR family winged helix-turn-helix transcriptional regulator n=1 Tax=Azospirillum sp. TSO35-2 TaxID=716796 RepID=UPI000D60761F|nr:MarR family transcriptional regulator [Azospirillum sp. TSO35-2]PWC37979.1 MarR family transcriptional regulator [Azospirillum sp. TSO35-2]